MRAISVVFVSVIFITGCVGATVVGKTSIRTEKVTSSHLHTLNDKVIPWSSIEHPANGTLIVNTKPAWCGLILWAIIIPIPLALPVCESNIEATFIDNKPISQTTSRRTSAWYICGPIVTFGHAMAGQSSGGIPFCGHLED